MFCFRSQATRNLASSDGKDWQSVNLSYSLLSSMAKQLLESPFHQG